MFALKMFLTLLVVLFFWINYGAPRLMGAIEEAAFGLTAVLAIIFLLVAIWTAIP